MSISWYEKRPVYLRDNPMIIKEYPWMIIEGAMKDDRGGYIHELWHYCPLICSWIWHPTYYIGKKCSSCGETPPKNVQMIYLLLQN